MNVHQIVEAVLFASDAPLTADEIARADEMLDEDQVEEALQFLRAEYDDAARSFQIHELAEGYQILTRPEYAPYLERFDNVPRSSRLSGPALETLAIIAYRQPIGRLEVEYIRGVSAAGVIRTLQDRRLIDVVGRAEGLGRPLLYGTTTFFLEHFGFGSLEDLPRPDELPVVLRDRIPLGPEDPDDAEGPEGEEPSDGTDERDPAAGAEPGEGAEHDAGAEPGAGPEPDTEPDTDAGRDPGPDAEAELESDETPRPES
ncbi:MAG: SMC-Scp complex subunit ScpB [Longimicrobiales bacterium]